MIGPWRPWGSPADTVASLRAEPSGLGWRVRDCTPPAPARDMRPKVRVRITRPTYVGCVRLDTDEVRELSAADAQLLVSLGAAERI